MSQAGDIDVVGSNPDIATTFDADTSFAIPVLNILNLYGDNGITTIGSGNTVTITGINATAGATAGTATIGVASFDSAAFTVTNGFVELIGGGTGIMSVLTDDGAPAVVPNGSGEIEILGGLAIDVTGQGAGNTISVAVDITQIPTVATSYTTDSGTATPALGILNVAGGYGISTSGATNVVTIDLDTPVISNDGSFGAPAFSFIGDTDSGFYSGGSGSVITVANGSPNFEVKEFIINSNKLHFMNAGIQMDNLQVIQTTQTIGNTYQLVAYDTLNTVNVPFITFTAGNPPTADLDTNVTINSAYIYRVGGDDVLVTDGGTGVSSLTDGGIMLGSGTNPVTVTAQPTDGQLLIGFTGQDPVLASLASSDGSVTITPGNGTIDLSVSAGDDAILTLTGTNGGAISPTAGNINLLANTVANATNVIPLSIEGSGSTLTAEIQVGTAVTGAPGDKNDAGLVSFDDTAFTVDANGYVSLAGGGLALTITTDDAATVNPVSNNWNVSGLGETSTESSGDPEVQIFSPRLNSIIVDPTSRYGTHTTIASAVASASSGDLIFIRPGTYTEDLTLTQSQKFHALGSTFRIGDLSVKIIGKCTIATNSIGVKFEGITLQTNSDYALSVTGTSVDISYNSCHFGAVDNDLMLINAADTTNIYTNDCSALASSTYRLFDNTSGVVWAKNCVYDSAGTFSASRVANGSFRFTNSTLIMPITTSGDGFVQTFGCTYGAQNTPYNNQTWITTAGTATENVITNSSFYSGTSSCISIGTGTTIEIANSNLQSSNATAAISGAGTLNYANLSMQSQSNITTTTKTGVYSQLGKYRAESQPSFLVNLSASATTVTGNGAVYTIAYNSEKYDQDSNFNTTTFTFTAPVTGRYVFDATCQCATTSGVMVSGKFKLVTSNQAFVLMTANPFGIRDQISGALSFHGSTEADMIALDTATVTMQISGGASDSAQVTGGAGNTYFSGQLIA